MNLSFFKPYISSYPFLYVFVLCLSFLSCTEYEFYEKAYYEQAKFSNRVEILWVVDNSGSMGDEQDLLAANFDYFINALTNVSDEEQVGISGKTITELIESYFFYKLNPDKDIDFQIGVTTTDTNDDGERGKLVGEPKIITPDTENLIDVFKANVVVGALGAGYEKGLEAARLAVCRALPWREFEDENGVPSWRCQLSECNDLADDPDRNYNAGFIREDSTLAVIIVSDEGDQSRPHWNPETDDVVSEYMDFFNELGMTYVFSVIVPYVDPDCWGDGANKESVQRYIDIAEETGGLLASICDESFATSLRDIGALISNLLTQFCFKAIPEPGTIRVFVDGMEVAEDQEMKNGWIYNASSNCIQFFGDAVPGYESIIEVFYIPQASLGREVPF